MSDTRAILQVLDQAEDEGIDTCTTCPKLCRWACPVAEAEARETSSPWNLMIMAGYLKRGLASVESIGALPYHCTGCGACTQACLHKNDVTLWQSLARARLVSGHAAPESVGEVRGHFGTAGNPFGHPLDEVMANVVSAAHGSDEASAPAPSGAIVYFPGCGTLEQMPEAAESFLRALTLNGIRGVAVSEVSSGCCGLPLLQAGDVTAFVAHAERHAARLASVDMLIVHDPSCAHAMKVRYAQFGVQLSPEIVHVSTFLAGRLGEVAHPKKKNGEERIALADSCMLRRGLEVDEDPRTLIEIATGSKPIEVQSIGGGELDCCGAGGLLPNTAPETADAMGEARLAAFRASGATKLVSFSPRCAAHLRRLDPTLDIVEGSSLLTKV